MRAISQCQVGSGDSSQEMFLWILADFCDLKAFSKENPMKNYWYFFLLSTEYMQVKVSSRLFHKKGKISFSSKRRQIRSRQSSSLTESITNPSTLTSYFVFN